MLQEATLVLRNKDSNVIIYV